MMTRPAAVSVVLPFFNPGEFLAEAVGSVLAQTPRRLGTVFCSSTTGPPTGAAKSPARQITERNPNRIRYVEHADHANWGAAASRNLGIELARGEYIALLDADDVWLSEKLERPIEVMLGDPRVAMWSRSKPVLVQLDRSSDANWWLRVQLRGVYQLDEDQTFLIKMYLAAPVFISGSWWDRHRQHACSCEATVIEEGRNHQVREYFLRWLAAFLRTQPRSDPAVAASLQRALAPYGG